MLPGGDAKTPEMRAGSLRIGFLSDQIEAPVKPNAPATPRGREGSKNEGCDDEIDNKVVDDGQAQTNKKIVYKPWSIV